MIQKHCFECGTALIEKELEEEGIVPYCPKCQQYRFPMYNVAVSMIVVDEETGKILLIQQYGKLSYILVAGYVNRGEAEEHAVVREVREETGLEEQSSHKTVFAKVPAMGQIWRDFGHAFSFASSSSRGIYPSPSYLIWMCCTRFPLDLSGAST